MISPGVSRVVVCTTQLHGTQLGRISGVCQSWHALITPNDELWRCAVHLATSCRQIPVHLSTQIRVLRRTVPPLHTLSPHLAMIALIVQNQLIVENLHPQLSMEKC
jgi:hypothetical protein